ncbi:Putative nucleoside-diphosphate sugar epimerase [Ignavibacterium album JCM 16511]|uniref:Putative nucleoside-diphosphate sugar epimerase n=1 Tax=Ignavibacterium album (strain DSM 19864 / JCM 16511 / NBRC 101810 / Mat9-16) TaxID=945713 RepID=I0AK90_IGNAJ|nr:NAD(P)-dependent oxidoreductase [Ignavibacterium album]AFH49397.1 Putative nucleoside-diphosphate sugar epimerase [Ignavibacterium album JCM 16511]
MKDKQVAVVTGGTGFVGSHLVDLLLNKGYEVRCITRRSSDLKWLKGKDVQIFDCGLYNKDALKDVMKDSDYVFHVAGVVKSKTKEGYFKGNVDTTKTLIEAALESGANLKRFLVVSSQTVTGPSYDGKPVNEETECRPITTYGKSKLEEEKLVLSYKDKLPITICRAPAVYGERDTEIFIYFKTFSKGLTTTIGFNEKKLSLIHVLDLVYGFYLAATNDIAVGNIYFISSEEFYTWPQINDITSKIIGRKPIVIKVPHFMVYTIAAVAQFAAMFSSKPATLNIEKAKDITQRYWICDTSKAVKELGYHQNISIEDGIKRTVEWYKKMKWI